MEQIINAMKKKKIDALLLTAPVSRQYLTGMHTSAGVVLVTPKESLFLTDFRYIEAAEARVKGFEVIMTTSDRPARKVVAERLKALGAARVGFEDNRMTAGELKSWKKDIPLRFVAVNEILSDLRVIKRRNEVDKIIEAQRVTEKAFNDVLTNSLRVGMTEKELCAEIIYAMYRHGAEAPSFPPIIASGENSALPHATPTDRVLEKGDFVTFDIGSVVDGYCSDMTRTVALGSATDEMREIYKIVLDAQTAGIAAAKAGVTGKAVDAAARDIIAAAGHGSHFGHGFGHGVGLEIHERPSVGISNDTPMPAGSIVTAEPGIYLPGRFGVRIEDMLYLTEKGNENLTETGKELLII